MSASSSAPGAQHQRFAAYLDSLARAAGHLDRTVPLKSYCTGLLLPGERKSVEPMAARLAPDDVQRMHQSLHHFVANAPWSDEALLERVRHFVLPVMKRNGSVVAWIVDDTGFVKKGTHSVGVVRQYCGQVGKQENCRVAVSLSVATEQASLPIAWRLYLPETWAKDRKRRKEAGIPKEIAFATKPTIALQQIRQAIEEEVTSAPVLADAAYGNDSQFREGLTELHLAYVVGVQGTTTVWRCGEAPLSAKRWKGLGSLPKLAKHRWIIERDYEELKQELGLGHYEGRGWRGFHHHGTLCIAAYGFLVSERETIPPSEASSARVFAQATLPDGYRPRGASDQARTACAQLTRDRAPLNLRHAGAPTTEMSVLRMHE